MLGRTIWFYGKVTTSDATLKLHQLLRAGHKYTFKKGQVVQSSDGRLALALIERGYIKRYQITSEGSIGIHGIYGPNNFFPLTLVYELLFTKHQALYKGPETFYYETMSDAVVYIIDNKTFVESVNQEPMLYRGLLIEAGRRLNSYIQRLENITLKTAPKRVAHQLVFYAQEFGEQQDDHRVKILLPFTQQTLADALSLTRETVTQSMGLLRQKHLIIKTGSTIMVLNIQRLDEFARS